LASVEDLTVDIIDKALGIGRASGVGSHVLYVLCT